MRRTRDAGAVRPATLGSTARAHHLLHVWCNDCRHQVDIADQAARHGADLPVPDWAARLQCSQCGSRNVDFVVTPKSTGGSGR